MKSFYIYFIIFIFSCSESTSPEQREKFEKCRKNVTGLGGLLIQFELEAKYGKDSFYDLQKMTLDEFVSKYNLTNETITELLELICENENPIQNKSKKIHNTKGITIYPKNYYNDSLYVNPDSIIIK